MSMIILVGEMEIVKIIIKECELGYALALKPKEKEDQKNTREFLKK